MIGYCMCGVVDDVVDTVVVYAMNDVTNAGMRDAW